MSVNEKNVKEIKNGKSYDKNGWRYVSVSGDASQRGYAYGYLVADMIKEIQEMLEFSIMENFGMTWDFFIEGAVKDYKPKIMKDFPELYEEMEGISKGCNDAGTKTSVDEIIAWNNYITLTENWFGEKMAELGIEVHKGEGGGQQDRCSAFIACGDYTEDGKIVIAHNSFVEYIDGQYFNVVLDIKPDKGHRIVLQTAPGWIWSGTDVWVSSSGIIGTETTIGGFKQYENKWPISCRIRKAMQYADKLDDYVDILLENNSGDYANTWLFGDINTNEIMALELGFKYHNVKKTKNGYMYGCNVAFDPKIRNLECANTGYCDIRRHQGSRQVRIPELMEKYKGKINIDVSKLIIGDHYDVYLNKENPCSRSVCAHYDLDAREYMSQADRPKPFAARGVVDGVIMTTDMAKNMSLLMKWGSSCDIPFDKNKYCDKNMQFNNLRPYLKDRPVQPWTLFGITENETINNKKSRKNSKKNNNTKKNNNLKKNRK